MPTYQMDFSKQMKCRTFVVMRNAHQILSRRSEMKMQHGRYEDMRMNIILMG